MDVNIFHCKLIFFKIGEDPTYFIGMNSNFNKDIDLKNGKLWDVEAKNRFKKLCIIFFLLHFNNTLEDEKHIFTNFHTKNDKKYHEVFLPEGLGLTGYK